MIIADAVYQAEEIKEHLGFTEHSLRKARKQGLRVIYYCGHPYITGRDMIQFLDKAGTLEKVQAKFQEISDQVEELNEQTRKLNAENSQ